MSAEPVTPESKTTVYELLTHCLAVIYEMDPEGQMPVFGLRLALPNKDGEGVQTFHFALQVTGVHDGDCQEEPPPPLH